MLGGIWWNQWSFTVLMLAILTLSIWEYYRVMGAVVEKNRVSDYYKYVALLFGLTMFFLSSFPIINLFIDNDDIGALFTGLAIIIYYLMVPFSIAFIFLLLELFADSKTPFQNTGINILGIFYIAIPITLTNFLAFYSNDFDPMLIIGIILLIWANDAFAYVVGSLIGKHKLFPRISPGKTWEGTIGGIVCNFIVAYLLSLLFPVLGLRDWAVIAAIVSIFATFGDLVESMMKRSLNIKDTGTLFPGHGGMLDRFDAFFFAIPFVAAYLFLVK
jgi:phosphatidate cytidylyltransferase